MAVSSFEKLRNRIREAVHDTECLLFDDTALDEFINQAQREYSIYSTRLTSSMDLVSSESCIFDAPDEFISPVKATDMNGFEIPIVSWHDLNKDYPDLRKETGNHVEAICFDFYTYGRFFLFPKIPAGKSVGKLVYRRLAKENKPDGNSEAVFNHAVYKILHFLRKETASHYEEQFLEEIRKENASQNKMSTRSRSRGGSYY